MSSPPSESTAPKADPKAPAAAKDTPKKNRSMTRKAFGELLKRVITKPPSK
jgi:hypothetical protein